MRSRPVTITRSEGMSFLRISVIAVGRVIEWRAVAGTLFAVVITNVDCGYDMCR
eukprot:m.1663457 g.1663457  ORF g.1663457 m.1663457 type:complete len:54 (+) comp136808_c0_seq1:105-266(+)